MTELIVKSLTDVVKFATPELAKRVLTHNTSVNGAPQTHMAHTVDFDSLAMSEWFALVTASQSPTVQHQNGTERKMTAEQLREHKNWSWHIRSYVTPVKAVDISGLAAADILAVTKDKEGFKRAIIQEMVDKDEAIWTDEEALKFELLE